MLAAIRRSQALNWELPDRTAWAHCPATKIQDRVSVENRYTLLS